MKTGRNELCQCGSGRKFKRCHGGPEFALPNLIRRRDQEKIILEEGKRLFERHKTHEIQRQKQQGLGRPIISIEHKGTRFVAVGKRVHYGKWKTFYDFLGEYIKQTLGSDWGNSEIAKPFEDRHPVMQWYDHICRVQRKHVTEPGTIFSMPMTGASSAYNRLAYNLYLIAHNGTDIQSRLTSRLRDRNNFQGAFFETQVAAWMIRAGFELEFEDESDTTTTHCEFTATYKSTGEKYSVEAKSRSPRSDGIAPRRLPVGRQLRRALEKRAKHVRLVFIDLHKPFRSESQASRVVDRAQRILDLAEGMQIHGSAAPSAYVCLVNLADQYVLEESQFGTMISFHGFKIPDFMEATFPSLRDALDARERHWPMFQLMKSMEEHREIPSTFDGTLPSQAFSRQKQPRIQIRNFFLVPGPDGKEVPAKVTTAMVSDGKAICGFHNPVTDEAWIGSFPMTSDELAEYSSFPDTYFGVYVQQNRRADTPIELYDFFYESYSKTARERLLEFMADAKDFESMKELDQKRLAGIYCERLVYNVLARDVANTY